MGIYVFNLQNEEKEGEFHIIMVKRNKYTKAFRRHLAYKGGNCETEVCPICRDYITLIIMEDK